MKRIFSLLTAGCLTLGAFAAPAPPPDSLLYGVAYYYEYIPYERLDKDISMMKAAGINTVRLAESTWSTWEPHDGVYDFSKLDHVLDAMDKAGIHVIVGTPTDQGKRQLLIGGAGSGKVVWTGTAEPACSARQRYPFLAW